jgi:hypothetical protein
MNELPKFATYMVPMGCKEGDLVEGSFGRCRVYRDEKGMLRLRPENEVADARQDFEALTRGEMGAK